MMAVTCEATTFLYCCPLHNTMYTLSRPFYNIWEFQFQESCRFSIFRHQRRLRDVLQDCLLSGTICGDFLDYKISSHWARLQFVSHKVNMFCYDTFFFTFIFANTKLSSWVKHILATLPVQASLTRIDLILLEARRLDSEITSVLEESLHLTQVVNSSFCLHSSMKHWWCDCIYRTWI